MKCLVVYYSRTGTTKRIGEEIPTALGADSDEILDQKSRKGPIGWIRAGWDGMRANMTSITVQKTPEDYDMIILGSPIWVKMAPAVRTYLTDYNLAGKKVAFFTTQGGDEPLEAVEEMKEMVSESEVISTINIKRGDIKANKYQTRLTAFVKRLK